MKYLKNKKGLTLVELVVAMGIFLVVVTLAVGAFVSLIRLQTQSETMTAVQQNSRIVLEQISRIAKEADKVYENPALDGTSSESITFEKGTNNFICFKTDFGVLKKYNSKGCTAGGGFSLTSSDVVVNYINVKKNIGIPASLEINFEMRSKNYAVGTSNDVIKINSSVLLTGLK